MIGGTPDEWGRCFPKLGILSNIFDRRERPGEAQKWCVMGDSHGCNTTGSPD